MMTRRLKDPNYYVTQCNACARSKERPGTTEDQEIKELSNSNEVYSHEEEIYSVEIGKRRKRLPLMDQRERERDRTKRSSRDSA